MKNKRILIYHHHHQPCQPSTISQLTKRKDRGIMIISYCWSRYLTYQSGDEMEDDDEMDEVMVIKSVREMINQISNNQFQIITHIFPDIRPLEYHLQKRERVQSTINHVIFHLYHLTFHLSHFCSNFHWCVSYVRTIILIQYYDLIPYHHIHTNTT